MAAKKQGLTVEGSAYREQMRAALPFIISAAVPAEIAKLVTEPLQGFLAGGQTLLADVAPAGSARASPDLMARRRPIRWRCPTLLNLTLTSEAPPQ